jgi:hypothetical protein
MIGHEVRVGWRGHGAHPVRRPALPDGEQDDEVGDDARGAYTNTNRNDESAPATKRAHPRRRRRPMPAATFSTERPTTRTANGWSGKMLLLVTTDRYGPSLGVRGVLGCPVDEPPDEQVAKPARLVAALGASSLREPRMRGNIATT